MKHNVTIDRLRGLSVLVVICMHVMLFFPNALTFMDKVLWNGYYGVTAFFCTSGFLITANMLRRYGTVARVDLYAFYVMRVGRIIPPLFLLVSVLSLLSLTTIRPFVFPASLKLKDAVVSVATLRYNVYYREGGARMFVWAILWSLSIEEMFYLGYPFVAKITRNTLWLVTILIAVIIYAPIHRFGNLANIYDYFACFDGIALGALAALAANYFAANISRWMAWACMIVGGALALGTYIKVDVHIYYNIGLTLIAVGTALVLFASQGQPFASTRPWAYDPLSYLGRLSYEIYLFHMTIYALLASVLTARILQHPALVYGIVFLCVIVTCHILSRCYAEPLNRWIRITLLSARRPRLAETVP